MKKSLKIILTIILLLALLLPITYSYAIAKEEPSEKQFFEISNLEVTKSEKVEMIFNLDVIQYKEFIFELQSNEDIENVEISQNDNVSAEKNNNEIIMEINKENTNVNTINLYYSIPENKKVGDTIKFVATITNITKDKSEETELDQTKQETQSIELEVKIIEEKPEESKDENKGDVKTDKKEEQQIPNIDENKINDKQEITQSQNQIKNNVISTNQTGAIQNMSTSNSNSSKSNNSQTVNVTYNGSDNNYLSELSVGGYTLNKDFSKENTTYFITVENEIENLDISAVVEDDTATRCIYGNENLTEGTNKILISVTAENGNVRNYRIYVTRNS